MKSRESAYSARIAGVRSFLARLSPTYHALVHKATHGRSVRNDNNLSMFLGALQELIKSPAPFKAVRLEIDGGQVEEPDAEGRNE